MILMERTGRRYLRIVKFIDAFTLAYNALTRESGVAAVLECGKWSCLGMFLFLESCTMVSFFLPILFSFSTVFDLALRLGRMK